ncbi:hypothetical protein V492_04626, partial [Pseudogymnoascus sp. VKM F-4246]
MRKVARQERERKQVCREHASKVLDLEKQVQVLGQQVAGKRALWYEHNPRSGGRSGKSNPFATPRKGQQMGVMGSGNGNGTPATTTTMMMMTPTKMGKTEEEARAEALAGGQPITAQLLSQFDSQPSPPPSLIGPCTSSGGMPCGPAKPCAFDSYASTASRVIAACNGVARNGISTFPATSLIPFESNEELIRGFVETFDDVYLM